MADREEIRAVLRKWMSAATVCSPVDGAAADMLTDRALGELMPLLADQDEVESLRQAFAEALRKAQRPGSVLAQQKRWSKDADKPTPTGRWHWLWGTEGGGIGHEDASEAELCALNAVVHERAQEKNGG